MCRVDSEVCTLAHGTVHQDLLGEGEACGNKADASDEVIQKAFIEFLRLYSDTYGPTLSLAVEYYFSMSTSLRRCVTALPVSGRCLGAVYALGRSG